MHCVIRSPVGEYGSSLLNLYAFFNIWLGFIAHPLAREVQLLFFMETLVFGMEKCLKKQWGVIQFFTFCWRMIRYVHVISHNVLCLQFVWKPWIKQAQKGFCGRINYEKTFMYLIYSYILTGHWVLEGLSALLYCCHGNRWQTLSINCPAIVLYRC